jgi:hypothetical protein
MTAWEGLAEVYALGFYGFMVFLLYAMSGPSNFAFWFQIGNEASRAKIPAKLLFIFVVLSHTVLWPIQAILVMAKSGSGDDDNGEGQH